jgi:hypothetical protein
MPKAVILVFAHAESPSPAEAFSLRQCANVLAKHPIRLVCPAGLDISKYLAIAPNIVADFISPHHLSGKDEYNYLKCLPYLYERYAAFDYMLTYELDSFVFEDQLDYWCERSWDYIGAPWFEGYYECSSRSRMIGVGNSGFSLRNIRTARRALRAFRWSRLKKLISACLTHGYSLRSAVREAFDFSSMLANAFSEFDAVHEDLFWCYTIPTVYPHFRIPPPLEAIAFSFEANPQLLHFFNGYRLPFGAHKCDWARSSILENHGRDPLRAPT